MTLTTRSMAISSEIFQRLDISSLLWRLSLSSSRPLPLGQSQVADLPLALRTPPRVSTFFHVFPRFTCSSRTRPYNLHLFSAYIFIPSSYISPSHPPPSFHSASTSLVSKLAPYSLIFHPCSRSIMHPTVTSFMPFAALLSRFPSFLRFSSSSSRFAFVIICFHSHVL